jgi:hypothetical protein
MAYKTVPQAQFKVEHGQEKKTKAKSPLCPITQNHGYRRVTPGPKRLEALSSLSMTDVGRRGAVASQHRCLSWET